MALVCRYLRSTGLSPGAVPHRLGRYSYLLPPVCLLALLSGCISFPKHESAKPGIHRVRLRSKPLIGIGQILDTRRENGSFLELPGLPNESRYVNGTDIGPWVASALARELTQAGYRVVHYTSVPPDTVTFTITGKVTELTLNRTVVELQVRQAGMIRIDHQYRAEPRGLSNPFLRPDREQLKAALMEAYQELVQQVLRDIAHVTK